MHHFSIGSDIGGTFTDIVLLDRTTGQVFLHKLLSTPDEPARAVLEGIRAAMQRFMPANAQIDSVVHASTIANNLIFERKGAPIGLLTTAGFRDVIEMRRQERYDMYDIMLDLPEPLVPRRRRYGISERIASDGGVITALEQHDIDNAVADLVAQARWQWRSATCTVTAIRSMNCRRRAVFARSRRNWPFQCLHRFCLKSANMNAAPPRWPMPM